MYTQIFKIKYLYFEFVKILRSRIHVYIQVCTRFYEKIEEKSELIGKNFFYKILKVQRNFYIRYSIQNFWFINRESKLTTKYKSFLSASIFNKLNKRLTQQKKCIATFLNQFTPINDRKKKKKFKYRCRLRDTSSNIDCHQNFISSLSMKICTESAR